MQGYSGHIEILIIGDKISEDYQGYYSKIEKKINRKVSFLF